MNCKNCKELLLCKVEDIDGKDALVCNDCGFIYKFLSTPEISEKAMEIMGARLDV